METRRYARSQGFRARGSRLWKNHALPRSPKQAVNLHHDLGLRLLKMANVALITLPFTLCWLLYYINTVLMYPSYIRASGIVLMFIVLYSFFGRTYDAFLVSFKRIWELFYAQGLALLLADSFMYLVLWLMSDAFPNIWPALLTLTAQLALALIWCWIANKWYFSNYARQKTGIVYDVRHGMETLINRYGMSRKFDVQFACSVEECLDGNMERLGELTSVFLCGVHSHERNIILKYCIANGIVVYIIPRVGDVIMSGAKKMHMFHLPMMRVDRYNPLPEHIIAKRALDIGMSLLLLALFSPIMLLTAIGIKLEDGGSVLYRQKRLTRDGREFDILKFRSMVETAEQDGVARLSSERDSRVTKVGRIIRACRMDELPQLFNVLGGSMSLVGPRPERPEIAAEYEKEMPEFALRLQAKAGMTGYAQVYGKYNTSPYDKLQMDLMYISRPSIMEDVKILLATLPILFQKESTEGIAQGHLIASDDDKPAA